MNASCRRLLGQQVNNKYKSCNLRRKFAEEERGGGGEGNRKIERRRPFFLCKPRPNISRLQSFKSPTVDVSLLHKARQLADFAALSYCKKFGQDKLFSSAFDCSNWTAGVKKTESLKGGEDWPYVRSYDFLRHVVFLHFFISFTLRRWLNMCGGERRWNWTSIIYSNDQRDKHIAEYLHN